MYGGGRCEVFSDFLPSHSVSHWSHYIDSYRGAARCRCSLTLSSLMVLVQESKGQSHAVALLTEGFPACLGVQPTVCTSRPHSSNRSASAAPSAFFSLNWHVPDNEQHRAVVLNVTGYFLSLSLTHELNPFCGNLFELHFHVISLRLCLAALFLCVKPAQLLCFLLSSLWCRQTHQSGTLSSNYAPLTAPCEAGTCRFFHGWHW